MPGINRWILAVAYDSVNMSGEIWEYDTGNKQFIFFQTLPAVIVAAGVDHFYFNNQIYLFYTQHWNTDGTFIFVSVCVTTMLHKLFSDLIPWFAKKKCKSPKAIYDTTQHNTTQ